MKKKNTLKNLLFQQQALALLLFSLLVVVVWVVSSVYFSYTKSTLTQEDVEVIIPLDPKIDTKTIDTLEFRKWWTADELKNFTISREDPEVINAPATQRPVLLATPIPATSSGDLATPVPAPTPVASQSAVPSL